MIKLYFSSVNYINCRHTNALLFAIPDMYVVKLNSIVKYIY